MLSASDVKGLMCMMPAFATDDAADIRATATVSVDRMEYGLNRMIADGGDVIATTGSFGEFHTLLFDEFKLLAESAAEIVNERVPLFIGATGLNDREVIAKLKIVERTKAAGVLLGVPFYFPSSPENAVRFYRDIAELFPKLAIMVYHNPLLHNVKLTLPVMEQILKIPNVVAIKDSHRDPVELMRLMDMARGKMTMFCWALQIEAFSHFGADSFWSFDAWMGPWPTLALRDAIRAGNHQLAKEITLDIAPPPETKVNYSWRETAAKIAIGYAGYVNPGPLRPPFVEIPAEVDANSKRRAERWLKLCDKYRSAVALRV